MYTFTSITYVQDTMTGELSTKRKNTSPAPPLVSRCASVTHTIFDLPDLHPTQMQ